MSQITKRRVFRKDFPESFGVMAAKYDPKKRILIVEVFNHGRPETLAYTDVPEEVFTGLVEAESKGGYFNLNIRDVYPYIGKTN